MGGFDNNFYRKIEESDNLIGLLQGRLDRIQKGYTGYTIDEIESFKNELKHAREIRRDFVSQAEDEAFVKSGNASQSVIGYSRFSAKGGRRTRHKRSGHKKHSNKKRSGHKRLHKKRMSRRR